jgi:ferritin-like metal-binding protein YciE
MEYPGVLYAYINNHMHIIHHFSEADLDQAELKQFFISHLNRIYCAKNQLADKLPIIAGNTYSSDLRLAVSQAIDCVRVQTGRLEEIYARLDASYTPESCVGLLGFLDEAFQSIGPPLDRPLLRDLSILFYMQNIESIEMASFEVMTRVADKLNESRVAQLLRECHDEARQDKALLNSIAGQYL